MRGSFFVFALAWRFSWSSALAREEVEGVDAFEDEPDETEGVNLLQRSIGSWQPETADASQKSKLMNSSALSMAGIATALSIRLDALEKELVYEIALDTKTRGATTSKVLLAFVEMLGLGLCGIDRCILGQLLLGCIKGATIGGFFVWFFIDYFVILYNCLLKAERLDMFFLHAEFNPDDAENAFWVCAAFLIFVLVANIAFAIRKSRSRRVTSPVAPPTFGGTITPS